MILGVISDTHGNRALMFEVADRLTGQFAVEWFYHAGDNYDDAQYLDNAGYKVRAVPGLWCPQYTDGRTPRRILDELEGFSVAMAHADKDLRSHERAADLIITGHTHRAALEKLGHALYLNPGHLRAPVDRGERASFAIVELNPTQIRAAIHEMDGAQRTSLIIRK